MRLLKLALLASSAIFVAAITEVPAATLPSNTAIANQSGASAAVVYRRGGRGVAFRGRGGVYRGRAVVAGRRGFYGGRAIYARRGGAYLRPSLLCPAGLLGQPWLLSHRILSLLSSPRILRSWSYLRAPRILRRPCRLLSEGSLGRRPQRRLCGRETLRRTDWWNERRNKAPVDASSK